jgi:tetratricopeptide (TPR) repeat protein
MHLNLGRLIWNLRGFPATEQFIFSSPEQPFYYTSWLFGLTLYALYTHFGAIGLILFKASAVTLAFFIVMKNALRASEGTVLAVLTVLVVVTACRYRFVERPDVLLMIFLPFTVFALNAYIEDGKRYLFALPVIHVLWGNVHSSIVVMFVPFCAFLAGGWLQLMFEKRRVFLRGTPNAKQLWVISAVFALSFLGGCLNPNGLDQYLFATRVTDTAWFKQEIVELRPPTWESFKSPFLIGPGVAIAFGLAWLLQWRLRRTDVESQQPSLIPLLLVAPFAILAFSAIRYKFILAILAAPALAGYLDLCLSRSRILSSLLRGRIAAAVVVVAICAQTSAVLALSKRWEFGVGESVSNVPVHALDYMDRQSIEGNVFNTFRWGGYIAWRSHPSRSVFLDPRGNIPTELLEKHQIAPSVPAVFEELDRRLKRSGRYAPIAAKDQYRFVRPANGIAHLNPRMHDDTFRDGVLAELERNIATTGSDRAVVLLGFALNDLGRYEEAIAAVEPALRAKHHPQRLDAFMITADAHRIMENWRQAILFYEDSLRIQEHGYAHYQLAQGYELTGDKRRAIEHLESAIRLHYALESASTKLIDLYRSVDEPEKAEQIAKQAGKRRASSRGRIHFDRGVSAYAEMKYGDAAQAFLESIEANPNNPAPYSNLAYVYFDTGRFEDALAYHKHAIDIDPDYANSHYGLGLVYSELHDMRRARHHWEEYVRIQPKGFYTRRAQEELEAMDSE